MGALDGLKILDFSTLLPGPFSTLMLADLGAEVLKVSSKSKPDVVIDYPPYVEGTETSVNQAWLGRNKKTISLNLKSPEAIEIIKKLVMDYDIIMDQFRPGVMDKLGIGYEELKKINPRVIYCSLTGYGCTGAKKDCAGHDINFLARSGNMDVAGRKSTGPALYNMQIADVAVGSMNSVIGILAAVYYRNKTGEGQFIDISMQDGLIPFSTMDGAKFLATGEEPQREGERLNGGCMYDFYETKDGKYISVGAIEPKFWENFCNGIEMPNLISGGIWPENIDEAKTAVKAKIKSKTRDEWIEIFKDRDACTEPVLSLKEALLEDEHNRERGVVVDVKLPDSHISVKQPGCAIKLSKCPPQYKSAGFPIGYHTKEVMDKLGFSEKEIEAMESRGVFK